MLIAWRILVAVALSGVGVLCGPTWWTRGVSSGNYDYAGAMVMVIWGSFYLAARIGTRPDPVFSRLLLIAAVTLAVPPLCYHAYDATGRNETVVNLAFLTIITVQTYYQLVLRPRAERRHLSRMARPDLRAR